MPTNLTYSKAADAVKWFQDNLRMQDWDFSVNLADDPPDWADDGENDTMGMCVADARWKTAKIWISNKRINESEAYKQGGATPLISLFHELLHSLSEDVGFEDGATRQEEAIERLAEQLNKAYLYDQEKKKNKKEKTETKFKSKSID